MSWTALGLLLALLLLAWRLFLALRMRRCALGADLRRKRVVLTGGTAGFGRRVLMRLVEARAEAVLFVGRDAEAGAAAVAEVQALAARRLSQARDAESITHFTKVYGDLRAGRWLSRGVFESESLLFFRADLADLAQVGLLSAFIREKFDRLDLLLNNAGAIHHARQLSAQGLELTMAGNLLGPALLVNDLLGLLRRAPAGRVVNVSSCFHYMSLWLPTDVRVDFADPLRDRLPYHMWHQYSVSKLGVNLLTKQLARQLGAGPRPAALKVVSVFPGICYTRIGRGLPPVLRLLTEALWFLAPLLVNTVEESCQTIFTAVFAPHEDLVQGAYYENCRVAGENSFVLQEANVARFAAVVRAVLQKHRPGERIEFPAE